MIVLKNDVAVFKGDMTVMKGDVTALTREVNTIKEVQQASGNEKHRGNICFPKGILCNGQSLVILHQT